MLCVVVVGGSLHGQHLTAYSALVVLVVFLHGQLSQQALGVGEGGGKQDGGDVVLNTQCQALSVQHSVLNIQNSVLSAQYHVFNS